MTVASDLKTSTGIHVVGYLAIEGVEPLLFEKSDKGTPTGWSRSIKACLNPPTSFANEIDIGEARPEISAATFTLQDIKDSDGTSFFGKIFSTGRWTFNPHARMTPGTSFQSQINANADFIPLKAIGSLSANSNGFITRESINWGETNADGLLNVTKGQWPAVNLDSNYGYSYHTPPNDGAGHLPHVGSVGFAMNGRRVAYYITTYDRATGAFNSQVNSELIWVGRISNEIQWAGADSGEWKIACDSITNELSQKTPSSMAVGTLDRINIGGFGDSFRIYVHTGHFNGALIQTIDITVPTGAYTTQELITAINTELADSSNTTNHRIPPGFSTLFTVMEFTLDVSTAGGTVQGAKDTTLTTDYSTGKAFFNVRTSFNQTDLTDDIMSGCRVGLAASYDGKTCHALGALGFHTRGTEWYNTSKLIKTPLSFKWYFFQQAGKKKYSLAWHPLHRDYNSSKLYVSKSDVFWVDQGDASTPQACVKVDDTTTAPYWNLQNKEGTYYARYSSRVTTNANYLVLTTDPQKVVSADGFVNQEYGKDAVEVQQVYIPHYKPNVNGTGSPRGPFELLLYPLLSTGTRGYNHATYDKCPIDLGLAVQKELVDISSFLQADKYALSGTSGLGHRRLYAITKSTSWLELVQMECKLFGFVMVWRKGKLRLRPVLHAPGVDGWTKTLSDSSRANPEEVPTVVMSTATVVNQYACRLRYDVGQDKFGPPIIITDVDSVLAQGTKQVKIDHTGVSFGPNSIENARDILESNLLERWIRFPLPVLTQSLAPTYVNEVFAGDVVKYTSSLIPDPYGSGTMTTSTLATVLSSTWDYLQGVGECLLMLHDRSLAAAWAPAALVDRTVAGGGLHNASNQIQLIPYTFTSSTSIFTDGNAVAEHAGWAVEIIERSPVDPTAPKTFGPWNTVAAYFTSNHCVQVPPDDFAGWDTTGNTEYFMTFANVSVINVTQLNDDKGTWQANADTELLFGTNVAQVYK